jgi:hypothetical protein
MSSGNLSHGRKSGALLGSVSSTKARRLWLVLQVSVLFLLSGCATCKRAVGESKRFNVSEDGFAFANELKWEYGFDERGVWRGHKQDPPPSYALHCFPMARAARAFFYHARFEAEEPRASAREYGEMIRKVLGRGSRCPSGAQEKIVIPGYKNLFEFSRGEEAVLKSECGGGWRSFLQRGNWRMVFPFTRKGQARVAEQLKKELDHGLTPIAHVMTFPSRTVNHFVVMIGAEGTQEGVLYRCYDPNAPGVELSLVYNSEKGTFVMPVTRYFPGGEVRVYEVEKDLFH